MLLPEIYTSTIEQEWEKLLDEALNSRCKYYASDIIRLLEMKQEEFAEALLKAEKAMEVLDVPIGFHVQKIYRSFNSGIASDMKLSPLAAWLISIHSEPSNSYTTILQHYLAEKYGLK